MHEIRCTTLVAHKIALMVVYTGYKLLNGDRNIFFEDVENIWHALQDPDTFEQFNDEDGKLHKVSLRGSWGQRAGDIANMLVSDKEKTNLTAQLCWCIYATVMYGSKHAQGAQPWGEAASEVWRDSKRCPAVMNDYNVPLRDRGSVQMGSGFHDYPLIMLGNQEWRKGETKCEVPVKLSMHRFACWLAEGNPPKEAQWATHACGRHTCLRLRCMRWGNAQTNVEDRQDQGEEGWRSRR